MSSNGIDFGNQILYADDAPVTKRWNDQCVICQGNLLLVDFAIITFVDQFIHQLQGWVPHALYGSTVLSLLTVALLSLTKLPGKI